MQAGVNTAAEQRRSHAYNLLVGELDIVDVGDRAVFFNLFPLRETIVRVDSGPLGHVPAIYIVSFTDNLVDVTAHHHDVLVIRKFKHTVLVEADVQAAGPGEFLGADDVSVNSKLNTHVADLTHIVHDGEETG